MKRQAFLDWSGNLGFKFQSGSSRYLVFALVVCDDYTRLRAEWLEFKRSRGFGLDFEFHYHSLPRKLRTAVFEWLRDESDLMRVAVLAVDKMRLPDDFRRRDEASHLSDFIARTAALMPRAIEGENLLIDGERAQIEL